MTSASDEDVEIESINDEDIPQPPSEKKEGTESCEDQLAKMKNEYLYLRAEFDNFRKNSIKERSQLIKYGPEPILREILTVVDNFDLALNTEVDDSNIESFQKGMEMTATELRNVLSKFGLKEEDPTGQPFDPTKHEALSSEPTDKVESGHVLNVFKKAYSLHDKLIRPAQVTVAREPDRAENSNADENASEDNE